MFCPAELMISDSRRNEAQIKIVEGKYHQIKRMLASRAKSVLVLERMAIGGLTLDSALCPGDFRELTGSEREAIFQ